MGHIVSILTAKICCVGWKQPQTTQTCMGMFKKYILFYSSWTIGSSLSITDLTMPLFLCMQNKISLILNFFSYQPTCFISFIYISLFMNSASDRVWSSRNRAHNLYFCTAPQWLSCLTTFDNNHCNLFPLHYLIFGLKYLNYI